MASSRRVASRLIAVSGGLLALTLACQAAPAPAPPAVAPAVAPAIRTVWAGRYQSNIQPIFDRYCVDCHGAARAEDGLRLTSYKDLMKGTRYGAVVMPGLPAHSTLISVVKGTADPTLRMPPGTERLHESELESLESWIEAGAPAN